MYIHVDEMLTGVTKSLKWVVPRFSLNLSISFSLLEKIKIACLTYHTETLTGQVCIVLFFW